jgi:hypothetical protein
MAAIGGPAASVTAKTQGCVCEWVDVYNPNDDVVYLQVADDDAVVGLCAIAGGQARTVPVDVQVDTSLVIWASTDTEGDDAPATALVGTVSIGAKRS